MSTPWLYDERTQVGIDYADEAHVREYDAKMQRLRDIPREVEVAAQALSISPEATVWEIGTGTGEMALGLASRCRHVYASDISPAMLAFARNKAGERNISNVTFEEGGFLSGFTPPAPVDGIVSQLALHHLPDFWKLVALRRIARNLRPGGALFLRDVVFSADIADYDAHFAALLEGVRRAAGDEVAGETATHIREEYSTFSWILEEMLRRAGLSIIRIQQAPPTTTYTCVRRD
jgi:ubiquinone/menaquinone biosynthesis C-methylase UbiE